MGIGLTVIGTFADPHWLNALADDHFRDPFQVLIKAGKPQFEIQAVSEDQLCPLGAFNIARRRLVFVDLGAGFGNRADLGRLPGDVLRHIGNHRKGGDHFEFFAGLSRGDRQQAEQSGKDQVLQRRQVQHRIPHINVVN